MSVESDLPSIKIGVDDLEVVVRNVSKGGTAVDIAQGPDSRHVRFQAAVDADKSSAVGFDPRGVQPQVVAIGPASGGGQKMRSFQRKVFISGSYTQHNPPAFRRDSIRLGAQDKADSFALQCLPQLVGHVGVFAGENLLVAIDDRHLAAEPAKHLPELQADVPAAEDQQVLRQFGQFQDSGVRQVIDLVKSLDLRDIRPSAGIDEDAIAFQFLLCPPRLLRERSAARRSGRGRDTNAGSCSLGLSFHH